MVGKVATGQSEQGEIFYFSEVAVLKNDHTNFRMFSLRGLYLAKLRIIGYVYSTQL